MSVYVPEYVASARMAKADAERDLRMDPVCVPLRYDVFTRPPARLCKVNLRPTIVF